MMGKTKKAHRTGRFKARYGKSIRERVQKIEKKQAVHNICPNCAKPKVKRLAKGIFECKKCGFKFAGGAYSPETNIGKIVRKALIQRTPIVEELIKKNESPVKERDDNNVQMQ